MSRQAASSSPEDDLPDEVAAAMIVAGVASLVRARSEVTTTRNSDMDSREDALWKFSGRWWAAPLVLRRSRPIR